MNIINASIEDLDFVYEEMLKQFPLSEMKPKEVFLDLLKNENFKFLLIKDADLELGYIFAYIIEKSSVVLLDQFGIFEKYQNFGYGGIALKLFIEKFSNLKGILLEIEKPNIKDKNTLRRIAFYERFSAYKLNFKYVLPSENCILPMDLYFINSPNSSENISDDAIKTSIIDIYENIFYYLKNSKKA